MTHFNCQEEFANVVVLIGVPLSQSIIVEHFQIYSCIRRVPNSNVSQIQQLTINDETLPEVVHEEDDDDDGDHDADEQRDEDRGVREQRTGVLTVNYELGGDRGCEGETTRRHAVKITTQSGHIFLGD